MSLEIKYIDLQNFQAWKRARIPVSHFSIVVGMSSSGKTSIFRALQFLLYGEWDATYPHDPEKATAVAIEFENGTRVLRIRTAAGLNQAAIVRDGDTTKFEKFGAIIPGLTSLINVQPINIGTKEVNLNFSLQDDTPFMLSESRPTKAQWIGRLYGAHIINQMLREMAKDKKNTDARRKDAEDRLGGLEKELKAYATVEEQEVILGQARALLDSYNYLDQCNNDKARVDALRGAYDRDKWVMRADTKGIRADLTTLSSLQLVKEDYDSFVKAKAVVKKGLKLLKVDAKGIKEQVGLLQDLRKIQSDLEHVKVIKEQQREVLSDNSQSLLVARTNLNNAILQGDQCPVCGGDIGPETHARFDKEHMLSNIARLVGAKQ